MLATVHTEGQFSLEWVKKLCGSTLMQNGFFAGTLTVTMGRAGGYRTNGSWLGQSAVTWVARQFP